MTSLSQAKTMGGIGAILVLFSFIPFAGALFGIIGFVMVLIAIKYIADDLHENRIFNNMVFAIILAVLGIIVASLVILPAALTAFQNSYFGGANFTPSPNVTAAQWISFGTAIGLGLLAAWVFLLASSVFLRRSYNEIGNAINVQMFSTAGLLYLIGAATAIIGVGFLVLLVAQILTAVAFLSIPERAREPIQRENTPITH
jgi:uncharacterized membrane protein